MGIPKGPRLLNLSTVVLFVWSGLSFPLLLPVVNYQLPGSANGELGVAVPDQDVRVLTFSVRQLAVSDG